SAADIYIRKLERTGTATHTLGLKSAAARRELGVLAGELARGNFGALRGSGITLANRAGWIEQLMSPKGMIVGDAAKWAWDRMLDIGREDTLDEKIATLQEKIARARKTPWTVSSS
ncbi:hypothetical protein AKI17_23460, partial [Salmonella enterica subsp. enterica serovar Newport]|nr:hypothetical protein [Salmonella enterica]ECW6814509.1 hypothetical protein [Salmonella enterica subsp. enterica serovar Newport]EBC5416561.1 hypothetical protein [Salmonella enterica]EBC6396560.1 hypothetical protein [Salmonella enterica]EBD2503052.1 hypothetical protein [Salmonella enterica]